MIELQNLKFRYGRKKNLFDGLNLNISPGNIYGLLGKNGMGKTTLLKIIAGLLFPKEGKCEVFGKPSESRSVDILKEIYFIPEEFYTPPVTIREYESLYAPFYPRFDGKVFHDYIKEFGLSEKDKISTFSYGQKKKFLLSFGLATDCSLFILDEPSNGLDIPSKSQFRKLLASSISEKRTYIISTHQVRDMENLIDPIIILDEGKVLFHQTIESITSKLAVEWTKEPISNDNCLYSEQIPGGYCVIRENKGNEETRIDLETLFNAVISNGDKINRLF